MRTIAYDVIGVNVFLPTLMRILPKKGDNFIPPILLLALRQQACSACSIVLYYIEVRKIRHKLEI